MTMITAMSSSAIALEIDFARSETITGSPVTA